MLARYSMVRGQKASDFSKRLREGTRVDTRKHTRHFLRPDAARVESYLRAPDAAAWGEFERAYLARLEGRFAEAREPFDALARAAREGDVFIGCSCPTRANPDVNRCHTVLALRFMKRKYRTLEVTPPLR